MSSKRRKVCVVTGSRAEYGLLRHIISKIAHSGSLDLQLLVTGSHLSPDFGSTVSEIEGDGYVDYVRAPVVPQEDDALSMAKSIGIGVTILSEELAKIDPELVLLLGDRFEILATTIAAYTLRIPVVHFHGGEVTGGALDEGYRHAITKMASIHFVAADEYRKRVIQMGEDPGSVHTIGSPGLEAIHTSKFMSIGELVEKLGINLTPKGYLVVAFHPQTASPDFGMNDFTAILKALDHLAQRFTIVISKSNADAGGRSIGKLVDEYAKSHPGNVATFTSLGHRAFTSLVKQSAAIIGNSSSGIIEAPALGVPTVNVGDRQKGRLLASSVITVDGKPEDILDALGRALLPDPGRFAYLPYGTGSNVSDRVLDILTSVGTELTPVKLFYDLPAVGDA